MRIYQKQSKISFSNITDAGRNSENITVNIAKGSTALTLARKFVEFVVEQLDLTIMIELFDSINYGTDEMLFPTLLSDDTISKCFISFGYGTDEVMIKKRFIISY